MVRFSDMLGGSGEPEDGRAATSPFAELAGDLSELDDAKAEAEAEVGVETEPEDEPEPDAESAPPADFESPEAVLARLTQYATSARAVTPADETEVPPEAADGDDPAVPLGDDFLPHPKAAVPKPGWGRKRRP